MTRKRVPHGTGVMLSFGICAVFWWVLFSLAGCAIVEPVMTVEARLLYPIPEPLRIEDYELRDGWVITEDKVIAYHEALPVGALQSHCADRAGPLGFLAMGCTYWEAGDPVPTIAVHVGAADYTIRHEAAHALQMLKGWGPSTLEYHYGIQP